MRHLALSDHAADQISQAEQTRQRDYDQRVEKDKQCIAPMLKRGAFMAAKAKAAWATHRYAT